MNQKMSLTAIQLWLSHAILERGRMPKDDEAFEWLMEDLRELAKELKEK